MVLRSADACLFVFLMNRELLIAHLSAFVLGVDVEHAVLAGVGLGSQGVLDRCEPDQANEAKADEFGHTAPFVHFSVTLRQDFKRLALFR